MCDRRLVVVQSDDVLGHLRQHVGAVALTAARLQHATSRAQAAEPLVDDLMAAEPVVLLGDAGHGPLSGQRQRGVRIFGRWAACAERIGRVRVGQVRVHR
ncbi:Uncharacterised protein [Mycobacteroides abscessus subsp. abscessus]|nr:Uncharacterised protein [Mycobacteroides abscessus subsp. abscessus]